MAYRERWNPDTASPATALGAALLVSGPPSTAASPRPIGSERVVTDHGIGHRNCPKHTATPKKETVRGARAFDTAGRSAVGPRRHRRPSSDRRTSRDVAIAVEADRTPTELSRDGE
ncbi:hypothetical protein A6E15_06025 [Natrinema saccharevitans]|uniref:Uncharacterized protein n=1 Tax=Natrinema saccharevitans TaxID=301967 RepID=A0A1S8AV78_9EURY|nr:hypothetical protein A6E15_06025 [Natrinema saccharevitans]